MEFEPNHILCLSCATLKSLNCNFKPSQTGTKVIMGIGEADQPSTSSSCLSVTSSSSHLSETAILPVDPAEDIRNDAVRRRRRSDGEQGYEHQPKKTLGFRPIGDKEALALVDGQSTGASSARLGQQHGRNRGSLDITFLKRFLRIHYLLFKRLSGAGPGGGRLCCWLFLLLLVISLLNEYIVYHVGLIPSKYYKVLGDKDLNGFWSHTTFSSGLIVGVALAKSTKQFIQKLLTAGWRQLLTKTIHREYFANLHYYKLNVLDKLIDNPDQRMAQDIDKFTSTYCDILPKFILAPFLIGYYSYEAYTKAGWQAPTACFGFFLIGATINRLLMGPVVKYVIKQEKYEGDFRFIHMLIRIHSESIAFSNASELEHSKMNLAFDQLIKTQYRLYLRQYFLNLSINLFDYTGSILSYLLLALPIFTGAYDNIDPIDLSSIISQTSFVTMYLIYQFTSLVDTSVQFADVTGVSHRIGELIERLDLLDRFWSDIFQKDTERSRYSNALQDFGYFKSISDTATPFWNLHNVSFASPFNDNPIVKDLTLSINLNESLLISGPSNSGKSSLFRVLRGLWPVTTGTITRHFHSNLLLNPHFIFYSPQKLYLTAGSLRQQITFPSSNSSDQFKSEADESAWIKDYLAKLGLTHLLDRVPGRSVNEPLDRSLYESLSPGEIQRLCILRVFYHRPLVAFLDESTSALPVAMEEIIYQECQRLNITTISIGHRDTLRQFHRKLLVLSGSEGNWSVQEIQESALTSVQL